MSANHVGDCAPLFIEAYKVLRAGRHKCWPDYLAGEMAFLRDKPRPESVIGLAGWLSGCEGYLTRLVVQHARKNFDDTYHGPQSTGTKTRGAAADADADGGAVAGPLPGPSDE